MSFKHAPFFHGIEHLKHKLHELKREEKEVQHPHPLHMFIKLLQKKDKRAKLFQRQLKQGHKLDNAMMNREAKRLQVPTRPPKTDKRSTNYSPGARLRTFQSHSKYKEY